MLPKHYRLSLKQTKFVKSAFKVIENPLFRLYLLRTTDSRGAIIVSKKQVLKSTDRNLLKRKLSAVLPPILKRLTDLSVVVWVKKRSLETSQEELEKTLFISLKSFLN